MIDIRNRIVAKLMLVIAIIFMVSSCLVPTSKDSYLQDFEKFVDRVKKHHKDYNKKDWKWADSMFEKYSKDWYQKFKNDLTTEEKLEVVKLKLLYRNYKEPDVVHELYKNFIDDDATELKEKFDEYIEEDFEEDIDKLIEGMKEIGDSAVKVVEDIIEKIDNRF